MGDVVLTQVPRDEVLTVCPPPFTVCLQPFADLGDRRPRQQPPTRLVPKGILHVAHRGPARQQQVRLFFWPMRAVILKPDFYLGAGGLPAVDLRQRLGPETRYPGTQISEWKWSDRYCRHKPRHRLLTTEMAAEGVLLFRGLIHREVL